MNKYNFRGASTLRSPEGGTDTVEMNPWQGDSIKREDIIQGVNDGDFGTEHIVWAAVHVEEVTPSGLNFIETIFFTSKELKRAGK
jgi:hypothetical protein